MVHIDFLTEVLNNVTLGTPRYNTNNFGSHIFKFKNETERKEVTGCNGFIHKELEKDLDKYYTVITEKEVEEFKKKTNKSLEEIVTLINDLGFGITFTKEKDNYIFKHNLEDKRRTYFSFCMIRHLYYEESVLIDYFTNLKQFNPKTLEEKLFTLSLGGRGCTYMLPVYIGGPIDLIETNCKWRQIKVEANLNRKSILEAIIKFLEIKDRNKIGLFRQKQYPLNFLEDTFKESYIDYKLHENYTYYKTYKTFNYESIENNYRTVTIIDKNGKQYKLNYNNFENELQSLCADLLVSYQRKVKV